MLVTLIMDQCPNASIIKVEENKSHYEWGSSSHTRTQKSHLTKVYVAPSVPIGESVSARSSFKSVQRNRLSFDSAVPKIGRSDGQDFKGPHTFL